MSDPLLAHADAAIRLGSKSFAAAARLFDPATRRSAVMLYAWCRHCDDAVDGQQSGFAAAGRPVGSRAALARLEAETRRAYGGEPLAEPAFLALRAVVRRHPIPLWLPLDHLAGFRMDVEGRRYETPDELLLYCYRVAGAVGVMMALVMGVEEDAVLDRACDLGLAFQLTNIARDVVEDAAAGRVYLPLAWLREAGIDPAAIAEPRHRPALAGVAARLLDLAEPYYASALQGLAALPPRSAWAVATARGVYRRIGLKVREAGPAAWDGRISTTGAEKLGHVLGGAGLAAGSRLRPLRPRPAGLWCRPKPAVIPIAAAATAGATTARPAADGAHGGGRNGSR